MSNTLQQAITLIKSGQKQEAQQLLTQILTADPNNEQAWLWLSAAVSPDKRRYCLEKALSINPQNQQAQQALAMLDQPETGPASAPPPSTAAPASRPSLSKPKEQPQPVEPAISAAVAGDMPDPAKPEIWINQEGKLIYITALFKGKLVSGMINPNSLKKVQQELGQGNFPMDRLNNPKEVPYNQITQVTQTMSTVRVHYRQANAVKSAKLEGKDDEMAQTILNALEKRLGAGFERSATPMGRGKISAFSFVGMVVLLGINAFCYFGALEANSGSLTPRGSARTRGIVAVLDMLGPGGVACIGGILVLLAIGVIIYYLANPPLITKLIPKGAAAENAKK
ncbi:MAG: hypothetical protein JW953_13395 [Anaerolineae bacterium]|nr:hypothetical protein [Anaerolineae bacterium]